MNADTTPKMIPHHPRLQRLLGDWRTYVAVIAASTSLLSCLTTSVEQLQHNLVLLHSLPSYSKWIAAALFAIIALLAFYSAYTRRSILLRPDSFIIQKDDPKYLIGRNEEIKALAHECEADALVFLIGESGAGKSALIRAGLLPFVHSEITPPRLQLIVIDASNLNWEDGLRLELAREIRKMPSALGLELGANDLMQTDDVFAWLSTLSRSASRRILLVLDQMDDYVTAHRGHFLNRHRIAEPSDITSTNRDWAALSDLVRGGIIHLLIVSRIDTVGMLEPLRFCTPATFLLPRIDVNLITPVLDVVSLDAEAGGELVVLDPDFGWVQLKERLLRDLASDDGTILPVQLVIALDSLRRFRFLTIQEYSRTGGAPGLERLHVQRHLRDASSVSGIPEPALLAGLLSLVSDDGKKTQRISLTAFHSCVESENASWSSADMALQHLERSRIIRRQTDGTENFILLHHDYLTRGVREVYRHVNRWQRIVSDKNTEFVQAATIVQRWKAMLSISTQVRLFIEYLRGRFEYGRFFTFAVFSLLKWSWLIALSLICAFAYVQTQELREDRWAEQFVAGMRDDSTLDFPEVEQWRKLSNASLHGRLSVLHLTIANPAIARKMTPNARLLAHAVVGLDPHGDLSEDIANKILLPALEARPGDRQIQKAAGKIASYLHLKPKTSLKVLQKVIEEAGSWGGNDYEGMLELSGALSRLAALLDSNSTKQLADNVIPAVDGAGFVALSESFLTEPDKGKDDGELLDDPALIEIDWARWTPALLRRMQTEKDFGTVSFIAILLAQREDLTAADAAACGDIFIKQIVVNQLDADGFVPEVLEVLAKRAEQEHIATWALQIVNKIKGEGDYKAIDVDSKALEALTKSLKRNGFERIDADLTLYLGSETDNYSVAKVVNAFGKMGDLKDLERPIASFVIQLRDRIDKEQAEVTLNEIATALEEIGPFLSADELTVIVKPVLSRMRSETQPQTLLSLGGILKAVGGKLSRDDLETAARLLVSRMENESKTDRLAAFDKILAVFSSALPANTSNELAATVFHRISTERDPDRIATLAHIYSVFLEGRSSADLSVVIERMLWELKNARNNAVFIKLALSLIEFAPHLKEDQLGEVADSTCELLRGIKESNEAREIAPCLTGLAAHLPKARVDLLWEVIFEKFLNEELSEYDMPQFYPFMSPEMAVKVAKTLAARMKLNLREGGKLDFEKDSAPFKECAAKLKTSELQGAVDTLIQKIGERESGFDMTQDLVEMILSFRDRLEPETVSRLANSLKQRIEKEQDTKPLADLCLALSECKDALPVSVVRPILDRLTLHIKSDFWEPERMIIAWAALEEYVSAHRDISFRLQECVDIMNQPLIVGKARKAILKKAESLSGERFDGCVWKFVDWCEAAELNGKLKVQLPQRLR